MNKIGNTSYILLILLSFTVKAASVSSGFTYSVSNELKLIEAISASDVSLQLEESFLPSRSYIKVLLNGAPFSEIHPPGLRGTDFCLRYIQYFEDQKGINPNLGIHFEFGSSVSEFNPKQKVLKSMTLIKNKP